MQSINQDITIEQGAKWEAEIQVNPDDYSLLNKEIYLSIKNVASICTIMEYSEESGNISTNVTTGNILINLNTSDTIDMEKQGIYKLEIIENGEVDRLLRGKVIVVPDPLIGD